MEPLGRRAGGSRVQGTRGAGGQQGAGDSRGGQRGALGSRGGFSRVEGAAGGVQHSQSQRRARSRTAAPHRSHQPRRRARGTKRWP